MDWRERMHVVDGIVSVMKNLNHFHLHGDVPAGCVAHVEREIAALFGICAKLCTKSAKDISAQNDGAVVSAVADAMWSAKPGATPAA